SASVAGGDDWLPGGAGRDVIYGEGRSNSIGANSHAVAQVVGGADFIDGGAEADALWGDGIATAIGFHAAVLHGGNDRIVGGQGD
ncbi:metalloprotease, partial [Escherichia coli]|nr:metalloprotease [Escherichia coli]